MSFRIVHSADWQLGRPYGRFDHEVRSALSEARLDAIDSLGRLAVLTRSAFADMLLEQGKPVSLILDGPLVYSDDGRLDTVIDILSDAATRMHVILLTCRYRAFRLGPGTRIQLKS